ncbi:MAG TPA: hypothetical protein VLT32_16030 [Candidatus Sulfomarinibacteraceae bacterium]|nr:hypothetical protein [Candidatus Sulfomarinibacteraceae bacterium]
MRNLTALLLIALLAALGCGGSQTPTDEQPDTAAAPQAMPDDDVHARAMGEAMGGPMGGAMHQGGGINAEVSLDPEIADDWQAIRVRVVDLASGAETVHEVPLGDEAALGDSGLTLKAVTFVPDFVMGEDGIGSRSAEPNNPAARVVITEEGQPDYEGWLFGAMPGIHPYPHASYGVTLIEGVPAE